MKEKIKISGFADEIAADFDEQLKVVTQLGMEYICCPRRHPASVFLQEYNCCYV